MKHDLQYGHYHLKQLPTMLTSTKKKEELEKPVDRLVSQQADPSEARENLLEMHSNGQISVSRGRLLVVIELL